MCYVSFRSTYEITTGKQAVMVGNGRTGHGENEEARTKGPPFRRLDETVALLSSPPPHSH